MHQFGQARTVYYGWNLPRVQPSYSQRTMNSNNTTCRLAKTLGCALLALAVGTALTPAAPTLWTNANITYMEPSPGAADVLIPGKVSFARGTSFPLYNAALEAGSDGATSPKDTMWAFGALTNYTNLTYFTFSSLHGAAAN